MNSHHKRCATSISVDDARHRLLLYPGVYEVACRRAHEMAARIVGEGTGDDSIAPEAPRSVRARLTNGNGLGRDDAEEEAEENEAVEGQVAVEEAEDPDVTAAEWRSSSVFAGDAAQERDPRERELVGGPSELLPPRSQLFEYYAQTVVGRTQVQSTRRRTSKRKSCRLSTKSSLQYYLERVLESPGGITKVLHLVQAATDRDVDEVNASSWTPLVGAIFLLGKNTTAKGNSAESEERLLQLVLACHRRGISLNSGAWFGGDYHRPLTVAAYYGYSSAVRLLVELGALPDLRNGQGQNAFISAFQNPTSGRSNCLRLCDERTAGMLLELGVVTSDLGLWTRAPRGTLCYVNDCSMSSSAMSNALRNKNVDAVRFLRDAGGVITDFDYLSLRRRGRGKVRSVLLSMVVEVFSDSREMFATSEVPTNNGGIMKKSQLFQRVKSWDQRIDWSFPPTWKVGVALCQDCGLPPAIFRTHVVPYLDRDWFYAPALLAPRVQLDDKWYSGLV